jgi:hypothetical protein
LSKKELCALRYRACRGSIRDQPLRLRLLGAAPHPYCLVNAGFHGSCSEKVLTFAEYIGKIGENGKENSQDKKDDFQIFCLDKEWQNC